MVDKIYHTYGLMAPPASGDDLNIRGMSGPMTL